MKPENEQVGSIGSYKVQGREFDIVVVTGYPLDENDDKCQCVVMHDAREIRVSQHVTLAKLPALLARIPRRKRKGIPRTVRFRGRSYCVRISPCDQVFIRDDKSGICEEVSSFRDDTERSVLLPGTVTAEDWADFLDHLRRNEAQEPPAQRRAA